MIHQAAPYLASILALGIAAQWLAWRLRVPAIVLLLPFGFLARYVIGPPANFIDPKLLFPLVSIAVGIILFEGGMSLRFRDIRDTRGILVRLVTIGLFITWVMIAWAAHKLLGFSVEMATLTGAMLTVSGPTVILPLVRNIRLQRRIGSLVKWEGIVNDPIGAILAALVFNIFFGSTAGTSSAEWARILVLTVLTGVLFGAVAGWIIIQLLRRYWLPDYLQIPFILAVVVAIFAGANLLQREAGLIAATLFGIVLANQRSVPVKHVAQFKENLSVLLVSTLFIVLAANIDVTFQQIIALGWPALAFLAVLIIIVRPISVFAATIGSGLPRQERILLAWIHPRGIVAAAVASHLALQLADTDFAAEGKRFMLTTFLTIVATVVVYGLTLAPLARRFNLASPFPQGILFAGASPLVREIATAVLEEGYPVVIVDTNHQNAAAARLGGLPVHVASIGSEFVRNEIDLMDVGRLMAMTPNDEVNTLAAMEFVDHFGQANVYQLAANTPNSQRLERVPAYRRGRTLFVDGATYEFLASRHAAGAVIKKTQLTADFPLENFLAHHGPNTIVLFLIDAAGKLQIIADDAMPTAKLHLKVIALVDPTSGGAQESI